MTRLYGKKAVDIALSILVLAGTLSLAWAGLTTTRSLPAMADASAQAENVPDEAFLVVIDAGHGGFDGGAVGTETGAVEAELNLRVAELLADELTKLGYYVVMTRSTDEALADTKDADMKRRAEIFNLPNADLVVSIHMNKFRDRSISGPMVFFMKGSDEGKALAESVMRSLCEALGRPQRHTNPEDLFVLRVPKAPSVLVECGFLSNAADERLLASPEYQKKLAEGIAAGIRDYAESAG